jgi:hypothetical protein
MQRLANDITSKADLPGKKVRGLHEEHNGLRGTAQRLAGRAQRLAGQWSAVLYTQWPAIQCCTVVCCGVHTVVYIE